MFWSYCRYYLIFVFAITSGSLAYLNMQASFSLHPSEPYFSVLNNQIQQTEIRLTLAQQQISLEKEKNESTVDSINKTIEKQKKQLDQLKKHRSDLKAQPLWAQDLIAYVLLDLNQEKEEAFKQYSASIHNLKNMWLKYIDDPEQRAIYRQQALMNFAMEKFNTKYRLKMIKKTQQLLLFYSKHLNSPEIIELLKKETPFCSDRETMIQTLFPKSDKKQKTQISIDKTPDANQPSLASATT